MKSGSQQLIKVALSLIQQPQSQGGKCSLYRSKKTCTKLNLFGKGITIIKQLSQEEIQTLRGIKQIDLSHNALVTIENIKVLGVESLNLSHNKFIEEEGLVKVLVKEKNNQLAKSLNKLLLKGNPFIKKPLSSHFRRYLFSIQNDLELYSKEESEYLDLLVQRTVENLTLDSLFKRININSEFIKQYAAQIDQEEYQRWLLTKPEEYFKLIRRQMEWKLQSQQPYLTLKKFVANQLPLQLFNTHQNRQHSSLKPLATTLVLQLRKRNQLLIKTNKELMSKIENLIFNYLTQKKMLMEKQIHKGNLHKIQTIQTPLKNIRNEKYLAENSDGMHEREYPEIGTPIYIRKPLIQKKQTPIIQLTSSSTSEYRNMQRKSSPFVTPSEDKQFRNPFQDIIREQGHQDELQSFTLNSECIRQKYRFDPQQFYKQNDSSQEKQVQMEKQQQRNKENILSVETPTSTTGMKKPQNKTTSKTLFSLSQSLLQKPVIPSDDSLHFDLQQGVAQSQIQKMFFTILTKINPIYHLLYSPISSLKQTEKTQLIENLLQLLKEKMKYVQKLQRFKVLYENEKQKSGDLLSEGKKSKEGRQFLENMNASLRKQLKSTENQLQKLSYELQLKAQQSFTLRQQNEKLHFEMTRFNNINLEREQQEEIEQKIMQIRQQGLKKRCMSLILLRASKLFCFQQKMGEINVQKNKNMMMDCFYEWAQETAVRKGFKRLHFYIMSTNFNLLSSTLSSNISLRKQNEKKQCQLVVALKKFRFQSFNHKLLLNKLTINNSKKAQIHYGNKIKRILFLILKQNRQCEKIVKKNEVVMQFRQQHNQKLKKWVFNQWLIWQRGLLHKQIEVGANHQGVLACKVIENLCKFYSDEKFFQSKSLALQFYLRDIRKINSFHKMLHQMSLYLQAWKLKLFKINMFTKRTFFDNFLSGVRRIKNQRRIKQKDEQALKKKTLFSEMKEQKLKRAFKMDKFRRILRQGINEERKNRFESFKKQIVTEKLYKNIRYQNFFEKLKLMYRQKNILKHKKKEISFITKRYQTSSDSQLTIKSFFTFMRSTLRFKHNLINFFVRKNKLLMQKSFYQFRVSYLSQKSQFFEQKLKQLGPDIELIQQRQIQTNIEKISLTREIQLKNQQIQEYEKEVNELKMLLQAKEIKYEKLKDIYAESIDINSRGRDIYEDIEKSLSFPHEEFDTTTDKGIMKMKDSNENPLGEDNSKKFIRTIKQQDTERKKKVYNYTRFSPERDIKSTQRRRQLGMEVRKKQPQPKVKAKENGEKQKMSDFYPSFRRF